MTLTRDDIEQVLGPLDDNLAAQLAFVGGTSAELAEAQAWYSGDDVLADEGRELPKGRVAAFVALLENADYITREEV